MLKFRSMRVDAEKYSGAVLSAGENDPRITKVGRIIRCMQIR
ncbi:MAG: sugar transferase [Dorea formicigenerans]